MEDTVEVGDAIIHPNDRDFPVYVVTEIRDNGKLAHFEPLSPTMLMTTQDFYTESEINPRWQWLRSLSDVVALRLQGKITECIYRELCGHFKNKEG